MERDLGEFMSDQIVQKDEDGVLLAFVPTSCSIQLNQTADKSFAPSISLGLRLSGRDHLTTPEGRSLRNVKWSISIYKGRTSNEHAQANGAIGMLIYYSAAEGVDWKNEESCVAWAYVDHEPFSLLSKFVMSGRLPSSILIHARDGGLRYGWEPDGSRMVWDVKDNVSSCIEHVEISFGIAENIQDEESITDLRRPTAADGLHSLEKSLSTEFSANIDRINSRLNWILLVAVLAAAIAIFRYLVE